MTWHTNKETFLLHPFQYAIIRRGEQTRILQSNGLFLPERRWRYAIRCWSGTEWLAERGTIDSFYVLPPQGVPPWKPPEITPEDERVVVVLVTERTPIAGIATELSVGPHFAAAQHDPTDDRTLWRVKQRTVNGTLWPKVSLKRIAGWLDLGIRDSPKEKTV